MIAFMDTSEKRMERVEAMLSEVVRLLTMIANDTTDARVQKTIKDVSARHAKAPYSEEDCIE